MTEKTIGLTFEGNKLQVNITPYSVRTYKVRLKPSGREASPIEYAALPLDDQLNVLLIMNSVEKATSNRAILLQPNFCRTH